MQCGASTPPPHAPISRLQGVGLDLAARQGLDAHRGGGSLEGGCAIDGKAHSQDDHQASAAECACHLSGALDVAEGAELDEWASQQKTVGKADFHTAQGGVNTGAVSGQVAEVPCHQRGRGDRCLQHANEGVAVDGLHHRLWKSMWWLSAMICRCPHHLDDACNGHGWVNASADATAARHIRSSHITNNGYGQICCTRVTIDHAKPHLVLRSAHDDGCAAGQGWQASRFGARHPRCNGAGGHSHAVHHCGRHCCFSDSTMQCK